MSQNADTNSSQRISQTLGNTSARLIAVHVKSANKNIFRALLRLGSANLLVRLGGLVMNLIVAKQFGLFMDPYNAIYLLVTSLAQLFAGGLEASVIPVYSRVRVKSKDKVSDFFSTLLNLLLIILILFTVVLFIFSTPLVYWGSGLGLAGLGLARPNAAAAANLALGISLVPYLFPVLALMSLNSFMECILNAEGQYGWPAYAGVLVPVSQSISVLIAGTFFPDYAIQALCIGLLVGLTLELIAVIIRAHQAKIVYRPIIDLKNAEIRAVAIALGPPLFGTLIGLAAPLLDQVFTLYFGANGSSTALTNANKLNSVFTGVIFGTVARAALPYLSGQAAIKDWKSFKATLRVYIWALGIGMTILAVGVIIFAPLIVKLLFEGGKFTPTDTARVAPLMMALAIGLPATAIAFFTSRAFSAIGKTKVLMWSTILNVVLNAILDAIFGYFWGPFGIALATSIYYFVSMFFLLIVLRAMVGPLYLLTLPPEFLTLLAKIGLGKASTRMNEWQEERLETTGVTYAMKRQMYRLGLVLSIFVAGIIGTIINAAFTVRIAFGAIVLLFLVRYPYILLVTWIMLDSVVGSNVQFLSVFQGGNLLSGLAVGTLITMLIIPAKPVFKRFPSLAFLFAYLMWILPSINFSGLPLQQFLTLWLVMLSYVAIGVLTITLVTTKKLLNWLIDTTLFMMTLVAAYGIYDWFPGLPPYGGHTTGFFDTNILSLYRTGSVYYAPPTLAFMLSIMIPLGIYRMITTTTWQGRLLATVSTLIMTVSFVLTFARIPFVGFAVSLFVMALFLPYRKLRLSMISGMLIIGGGALLIAQLIGIPILDRFANNDLTSLNGRTLLWGALLDHFDPHNLLGAGLQGSDTLLIQLQVGSGRGVIGTAPHNIFLAAMYDQGLIGLALVILLHIAILWNLLRKVRGASPELRTLIAVGLAAYINILFQSIEVTVFWSQQVGPYLWILLSLPFARCWDNNKQSGGEDYGEVVIQPDKVPIKGFTLQELQKEQLTHV